jgi:hypothetical protein
MELQVHLNIGDRGPNQELLIVENKGILQQNQTESKNSTNQRPCQPK